LEQRRRFPAMIYTYDKGGAGKTTALFDLMIRFGNKAIDKRQFMTIIIVTMTPKRQFELLYPPIIKQHLQAIEPKYWTLIRDNLEAKLRFDPDNETRNRKPLKRPVVYGAAWELRFGPDNCFRAFYRIDFDSQEVIILAIGEKKGNRLVIGGEEIEL
jgi:hypothetical protein